MKIDVFGIVRGHLATLYDIKSNRLDLDDMIIFFVIPIVLAALPWLTTLSIAKEGFNVSITFFGIFVALLLNIQVAIFSVFQREWREIANPRSRKLQAEELKDRNKLLGEINTNISYLMIIGCFALASFLGLYLATSAQSLIDSLLGRIASSFCIIVYAHFLLTFLMVVKRAHALFQKEYRDHA